MLLRFAIASKLRGLEKIDLVGPGDLIDSINKRGLELKQNLNFNDKDFAIFEAEISRLNLLVIF